MNKSNLKLFVGELKFVTTMAWTNQTNSGIQALSLWMEHRHQTVCIVMNDLSDGQHPAKLIRAIRARSSTVNIIASVDSKNTQDELLALQQGASLVVVENSTEWSRYFGRKVNQILFPDQRKENSFYISD